MHLACFPFTHTGLQSTLEPRRAYLTSEQGHTILAQAKARWLVRQDATITDATDDEARKITGMMLGMKHGQNGGNWHTHTHTHIHMHTHIYTHVYTHTHTRTHTHTHKYTQRHAFA